MNDKEQCRFPDDVQAGLDAYATYYLALAHLEKAQRDNKPLEQAETQVSQHLELLPEPGPNQPYYQMLRWGANANLGRIYEATKEFPCASRMTPNWTRRPRATAICCGLASSSCRTRSPDPPGVDSTGPAPRRSWPRRRAEGPGPSRSAAVTALRRPLRDCREE